MPCTANAAELQRFVVYLTFIFAKSRQYNRQRVGNFVLNHATLVVHLALTRVTFYLIVSISLQADISFRALNRKYETFYGFFSLIVLIYYDNRRALQVTFRVRNHRVKRDPTTLLLRCLPKNKKIQQTWFISSLPKNNKNTTNVVYFLNLAGRGVYY